MKMPKLSSSPAMVPTKASDGRSASRGFGDGGCRRDAEKIGRSRVVDNVVSGNAHSGLALAGRSGAAGDGAGGGATTTAVGAGESQICAPGGSVRSRFVSSASVSNPAVVSADNLVGPLAIPKSVSKPAATIRFISHPAIVPTP